MGTQVENTIGVIKPKWLGVRHLQVLMIFLGMTLSLSVRTTMSIAIVAMTDSNNDLFFDWTIRRQSVILSSFTWGYIVLQSFSGQLASRFGGKNLLLLNLGVCSLISLVLPVAAIYGDWVTVCVCRGLQGFIQGMLYPTLQYLMGKWIPFDERGRMSSFIFSGSQLGVASQLIVSGYIVDFWSWPAIFYVVGAAGLIWTVAYAILGSDNPQSSKMISPEERLYIQNSLGQIGGHKTLKTPWKAIFTSLPFLATLVANVGFSWGYWVMLTELPTYMSKVLQVDIKSNGIMSALPYITMFAMNFPIGFASDYAIRKNWVSVSANRKICNSIGFFGPAVVLICLTLVPVERVTFSVFLLCLALGLNAGYYNGYIVAFLDIAHNFSSTLIAISNFTANSVALFAPLSAGFILKDETNSEEWHIIFYISASIYVITNVIFVSFASSEEQKWNQGTEITKTPINA